MTATETRVLYSDDLRRLCIERKWYTRGCNDEYSELLHYADNAKGCQQFELRFSAQIKRLICFVR